MTRDHAQTGALDEGEVLRVAAQVPVRSLRSQAVLSACLEAICATDDPIAVQQQSLTDVFELELAGPLARLLRGYDPEVRDLIAARATSPGNAKLAVLLALMMPDDSDAGFFAGMIGQGARLGWLADVIAQPEEHGAFLAVLGRARAKLLTINVSGADLRLPADFPAAEFTAFQDEMQRIYRESGQAQARAFLEKTRARDTALGRYLASKAR